MIFAAHGFSTGSLLLPIRSVGCAFVRAASALLKNGCAGSVAIGPCPRLAGGSCQSATLVCQPKFGEASGGMAEPICSGSLCALATVSSAPESSARAAVTCGNLIIWRHLLQKHADGRKFGLIWANNLVPIRW